MRQLVSEYSNLNQLDSDLKTASVTGEILNQADSEIEKVKQLVSKVPWQHNVLIIQKVKDYRARLFYLQSTVKNHYSRSVLLHQIKADAYSHFLKHPALNH